MTNDCELDQIINTAVLNDVQYKIAEDLLVQITPTWTDTRAANPGPPCPMTYEIFRVISNVDTPLTTHELAALTVTSYSSSGAPIDL